MPSQCAGTWSSPTGSWWWPDRQCCRCHSTWCCWLGEDLPVWSCYSDWCFVCYHTHKKIKLYRMHSFSSYTLIGEVDLFYQAAQWLRRCLNPVDLWSQWLSAENIYRPSWRSESCRNGDLTSWKQVAYENINSTSTAQHFRLPKFT